MDRYIPNGIAHVDLAQDAPTRAFSFVLMGDFSMLAFSAAIEPLRIANQLTGQRLYSWETLSVDGTPVTCSNGTQVAVNRALGDVERDAVVMVCSGVEPEKNTSEKAANWIRTLWRNGRTVGGLCTGAYTLAAAGILEGTPCTVHWENLNSFIERFPHLDAVDQLYCRENRVLTCGGGSAATDLMAHLIREDHGAALADAVLNMCLHHSLRPESTRQRSSTAALLGTRNPKLAAIVEYMHECLDHEITMKEVSSRFDLSQRQIERLFLQHLGTSPKRYLLAQRLERARALLADTNLPVVEVAVASGFASVNHFSKQFRNKYGQSPWQFSVSRTN